MKKKKVLLLNPPGDALYVRDYYCSKTSKSNYLFHPVDLLMMSGRLVEKYVVRVIDAMVEGLEDEACMERIMEEDADVIVFLTGAISYEADMRFLKKVSEYKSVELIGTGDVFLEDGERVLKDYEFISAAALDFTSDDIMRYLDGDMKNLRNMIYRFGQEIISTPLHRPLKEEYTLPVPMHELFISLDYRFPFVKRRPFATVLTDFGCAFKCAFCVMGTLGFRYRPLPNVMEELSYLKDIGVKEVFFIDQTFGALRERNIKLCKAIIASGLSFGWACYSRVDTVDAEMLMLMKEAGCHTVIFGVESASDNILKEYNKHYTKEEVLHTFALAKRLGLRTVATFIIGLPEESLKTCLETIEFAKALECDFASFNLAVARANTGLRKRAVKDGLISVDSAIGDQSGARLTMSSMYLSAEDIMELKKKAIRSFYLRPSYLLSRLKNVTTLYELKEWLGEGFSLLRNNERSGSA